MNVFEVFGKVVGSGEHILGARETGSHACYLIYGVLKPGEQGRELRPGGGHEEIILVLKGDLVLSGHFNGILKQGQAIHLRGEESCSAENRSSMETIYVIAGGHSEEGHQ